MNISSNAPLGNRTCFSQRAMRRMDGPSEKTINADAWLLESTDEPDIYMYISKYVVTEEMLEHMQNASYCMYVCICTNVIDAKQPTTRINAYECILYMCMCACVYVCV